MPVPEIADLPINIAAEEEDGKFLLTAVTEYKPKNAEEQSRKTKWEAMLSEML